MNKQALAIGVALVLVACGERPLVAQIIYPDPVLPGVFYNQPPPYGQSALGAAPGGTPGMFGYQSPGLSSLRNGRLGIFGYQSTDLWLLRGEPSRAPSIQQYPLQYQLPQAASAIGMPTVASPQLAAGAYNLPGQTVTQQTLPQPLSEASAAETQPLTGTEATPVTGTQRAAVSYVTAAQSKTDAASSACIQPSTRSTELSGRLTRIARSRGMLAGQEIDVYLCGNVAVVQGAVRTASSRVLLANVLGLEPGVQRIDNRLAVYVPQ